jgi:hypothetical protein
MKKAMELPANFLVMLILGLIMFGAALTIAYRVFFAADDLQKSLDQQTRKQIEDQLRESNGRVLLGIASKEIKRGDKDVFGVGIRNLEPTELTFFVSGKCNMAIDQDRDIICDENAVGGACESVCGKWITSIGEQTIESKDLRVESVHIQVPKNAKNGEYWFDVQVCHTRLCESSGIRYDTVKKLAVTVS